MIELHCIAVRVCVHYPAITALHFTALFVCLHSCTSPLWQNGHVKPKIKNFDPTMSIAGLKRRFGLILSGEPFETDGHNNVVIENKLDIEHVWAIERQEEIERKLKERREREAENRGREERETQRREREDRERNQQHNTSADRGEGNEGSGQEGGSGTGVVA